jgi:hypothetical protein
MGRGRGEIGTVLKSRGLRLAQRRRIVLKQPATPQWLQRPPPFHRPEASGLHPATK